MQSQHTLEDLKAQRETVLEAINLPGIPSDEREIYRETILAIDAQIAAFNSSTAQQAKNNPSIQATPNRSPLGVGGSCGATTARLSDVSSYSIRGDFKADVPTSNSVDIPSRTILAGGHAKTAQPITASIQLDNKSDQFNPSITITWSDGYQITVDETAATGRFKSTLRDTLALKCVDEGRFEKMWRWDTPWRASGFYQALTQFWKGPPSLSDLGYTRPTDRQREVFALITEKADYAATSN